MLTPPDATAALAEFVSNLQLQQIPASVRQQVTAAVIDTLGCGLAGSRTNDGAIVGRAAKRWGQHGTAILWGGLGTSTEQLAVLANATMAQALTFDDFHLGSGVHPGAVTVPVALALAATLAPVSGAELLTAIVAGYEVALRAGLSVMPNARLRGFHPVGICGPLAAAATAARLRRLDPSASRHALGIAGSLGAGLMAAQFDSMVQRLHAGRAAEAGWIAADLASDGFRGTRDVFEAPYGGFCSAFGAPGDPAVLIADLGDRFHAAEVMLRPHSCAASCATSVDAASQIMQAADFDPRTAKSVDVTVSEFVHHHAGWGYAPGEIITAQMNIQFCVATAMRYRRVGPFEFVPGRLADPETLDLIDRIVVRADPSLDASASDRRYASRLRVELRDGRAIERTVARPRSLGSAGAHAKFLGLAGGVVGQRTATTLLTLLSELEEVADVSTVIDHLRGPSLESGILDTA